MSALKCKETFGILLLLLLVVVMGLKHEAAAVVGAVAVVVVVLVCIQTAGAVSPEFRGLLSVFRRRWAPLGGPSALRQARGAQRRRRRSRGETDVERRDRAVAVAGADCNGKPFGVVLGFGGSVHGRDEGDEVADFRLEFHKCELDHSSGKENGRASIFAAPIGLDFATLAATGGDDAVIAFFQRQPVPLEGFGEADSIWVFRLCGFGGRGHRFLVSGF